MGEHASCGRAGCGGGGAARGGSGSGAGAGERGWATGEAGEGHQMRPLQPEDAPSSSRAATGVSGGGRYTYGSKSRCVVVSGDAARSRRGSAAHVNTSRGKGMRGGLRSCADVETTIVVARSVVEGSAGQAVRPAAPKCGDGKCQGRGARRQCTQSLARRRKRRTRTNRFSDRTLRARAGSELRAHAQGPKLKAYHHPAGL